MSQDAPVRGLADPHQGVSARSAGGVSPAPRRSAAGKSAERRGFFAELIAGTIIAVASPQFWRQRPLCCLDRTPAPGTHPPRAAQAAAISFWMASAARRGSSAADDDVVGAVLKRLRDVDGAFLVVGVIHRADPGHDDDQALAESITQGPRLQTRRYDAVATELERAPRRNAERRGFFAELIAGTIIAGASPQSWRQRPLCCLDRTPAPGTHPPRASRPDDTTPSQPSSSARRGETPQGAGFSRNPSRGIAPILAAATALLS